MFIFFWIRLFNYQGIGFKFSSGPNDGTAKQPGGGSHSQHLESLPSAVTECFV